MIQETVRSRRLNRVWISLVKQEVNLFSCHFFKEVFLFKILMGKNVFSLNAFYSLFTGTTFIRTSA